MVMEAIGSNRLSNPCTDLLFGHTDQKNYKNVDCASIGFPSVPWLCQNHEK